MYQRSTWRLVLLSAANPTVVSRRMSNFYIIFRIYPDNWAVCLQLCLWCFKMLPRKTLIPWPNKRGPYSIGRFLSSTCKLPLFFISSLLSIICIYILTASNNITNLTFYQILKPINIFCDPWIFWRFIFLEIFWTLASLKAEIQVIHKSFTILFVHSTGLFINRHLVHQNDKNTIFIINFFL